MKRPTVIAYFFGALLLFVLYSVLLIFSPFIRPIFWSAVIAFGFYPLYQKVLAKTGKNPKIAAFLTTMLVFVLFLPIVVFVIANLVREAAGIYDWALTFFRDGGFEKLRDQIRAFSWVRRFESSELFQREFIQSGIKNFTLTSSQWVGQVALKEAALITKNFFLAAINFFFMIFLVFFMFKDGARIYDFIYKITPLERHIKKLIFTQLSETFSAVLRGQILTAFAQASLAGIIFWGLGLPLPLFFAAATFLAAMVPLFGAAIIWGPWVVYLYFTKDYTSAVILLVLGAGVISLIDNVLKPFLIGEKTKLPYLLLFLGILGGMQVYGIMGIFLAPTVLSLFFVMIKIYQEEILDEKKEA